MKAKTKTNRAEPKAKRTTKTVKTVAPKPTKKTETVLVLRTCTAEMRGIVPSSSEFVWPERGPVQCKDWNPEPICGGGLHGLLWGEGEGINLLWQAGAKWLVVEVAAKDIVDLGGKVKFPRGVVVFCGDQAGATAYLAAHGGAARTIVGGTATAGYRGTATAGDGGTATAGVGGTATAGYRGTATAGDGGTATAGDRGTATAGDGGTATAGVGGTATAGDRGTATAGDGGTATAGVGGTATAGYRGTATAGDGGTATAGDRGTATAGDRGTATAGYRGTATAGEDGVLSILWWDGERNKYRRIIGTIGEEGLEPKVAYRVNDAGKFEPATKP